MLGSAVGEYAVAVEVRAESLCVYRPGEALSCPCVSLVACQRSVGFQAYGGCYGQVCLLGRCADRVDGVILQ